MFTGVPAAAGLHQQPAVLIPVHIAQYVSNASSTELTVLHNLIKYHLDNRNLPFEFDCTTGGGAWSRPHVLVPVAARSPLLPQQIPVQSPPPEQQQEVGGEEEEKAEDEKKEEEEKVDRRKLHVYRPKDSDWDWKTFRDEVIRALDHDKPISHIFCPKKASFVSIDFTESNYKGKDGFELAEEGVEKLRAKDFRVEFSILREKKERK